MANSPYPKEYISFTDKPVNGPRNITRQELTTYEWRGNTLVKIVTTRVFSMGGSDYNDEQTITPVYVE